MRVNPSVSPPITCSALLLGDQLPSRLIGRYPSLIPPALYRQMLQCCQLEADREALAELRLEMA